MLAYWAVIFNCALFWFEISFAIGCGAVNTEASQKIDDTSCYTQSDDRTRTDLDKWKYLISLRATTQHVQIIYILSATHSHAIFPIDIDTQRTNNYCLILFIKSSKTFKRYIYGAPINKKYSK